MIQKFGRRFRLTIDPADGNPPIIITMPFTIQFWIERSNMASLNKFSVNIANLSLENRRRIFQDRFNYQENIVNGQNLGWRTVLLEAGYSQLYTIFSGNIFEAGSSRSGTEIITRIEGRTGVYDTASTFINETFQAGQTVGQLLRYLAGKFPTISIGAIGNYPTVFNKPVALNGLVWELIQTYSEGRAFIDNDKLLIVHEYEIPDIETYEINDSTGILETPRRGEANIVVTTLFEPGITLEQPVVLNSSIEPVYNGNYKVIGIDHAGIISGAVSGELRTMLTLLQPLPVSYTKVPLS